MKPILKISLFLYVALLLTPGALKSAHIFADHQHIFCDHSAEGHIHEKNTDCQLLSFHQHWYPELDLYSFELYEPDTFFHSTGSVTPLIFNRPCSGISLRGPPVIS